MQLTQLLYAIYVQRSILSRYKWDLLCELTVSTVNSSNSSHISTAICTCRPVGSKTDAVDLAQNWPLWRLLATSGAMHWQWCKPEKKKKKKTLTLALCRLWVVRIDPHHFLAKFRKWRLNQALSIIVLLYFLYYIVYFFIVFLLISATFWIVSLSLCWYMFCLLLVLVKLSVICWMVANVGEGVFYGVSHAIAYCTNASCSLSVTVTLLVKNLHESTWPWTVLHCALKR